MFSDYVWIPIGRLTRSQYSPSTLQLDHISSCCHTVSHSILFYLHKYPQQIWTNHQTWLVNTSLNPNKLSSQHLKSISNFVLNTLKPIKPPYSPENHHEATKILSFCCLNVCCPTRHVHVALPQDIDALILLCSKGRVAEARGKRAVRHWDICIKYIHTYV